MNATGSRQENVTAFLRQYKREFVLIVVPRWLARATHLKPCTADNAFWRDTQIALPKSAASSWKNVFTGEELLANGQAHATLEVTQIFAHFPVALLSARNE